MSRLSKPPKKATRRLMFGHVTARVCGEACGVAGETAARRGRGRESVGQWVNSFERATPTAHA